MYRAIEQEDGTYTIKDVEIFLAYDDPRMEPKRIDERGLQELIDTFNEFKNNVSQRFGPDKRFLPSVHIGHHEKGVRRDQAGVGLLDNLYQHNGVLYADIVNIKPDMMKQIAAGRWPHRSLELVGDKSGNMRITSLALLESRDPYHKLPIMDKVQVVNQGASYQENSRVYCFSYESQLGGTNLAWFFQADNEKDKKKEDVPESQFSKYAKKYNMTEEEVEQYMAKYMDGFDEHLEKEKGGQKQDYQDPAPPAPAAPPAAPVAPAPTLNPAAVKQMIMDCLRECGVGGPKPPIDANNIAMQNPGDPVIFQLQQKIINLERESEALKQQSKMVTFEDELKQICFQNANLNFDANKRILSAIPKDEDRRHFLGSLKESYVFSNHRANMILDDVTLTPVSKTEQKYQKESPAIKNTARKLHEAYNNTIQYSTGEEKKMFMAQWSDVDEFVDFHLGEEKRAPGYCDRSVFQS